LALERKAILAIGAEIDLKNISTCRRKALEGLGSGSSGEYINFLMTLAESYKKEGIPGDAHRLLQAINVVEPKNWYAKKELAIMCGVEGKLELSLRFFGEAARVFEDYEREFAVEALQAWEAKIFEARFRILSHVRNGTILSRGELNGILEPFHSLPEEIRDQEVHRFYYHNLKIVAEAIFSLKLSWKDALSVLLNGMERERHEELIKTLGEMPARVGLLLSMLAKSDMAPSPKEILAWFGQEGPGDEKRAAALYTWFMVERALDNGNKGGVEAAKLLKRRKKALGAPVFGEMSEYLDQNVRDERTLAAKREVSDFFDALENNHLGAGSDASKIAQRLRALIEKSGEGNARDALQDRIGGFLLGRLQTAERYEGAVSLAVALYGINGGLDGKIKRIFESVLKEKEGRERINAFLIAKRQELLGSAVEVAKLGDLKTQERTSNKYMKSVYFQNFDRLHDFFFVQLADLAVIREIYAEINGPLAEPESFRVFWYSTIGENCNNPKQKIRWLKKAGSGSLIAQLDIAREMVVPGKGAIPRDIAEARQILERILASTDNVMARVKAYCSLSAAILAEAERGQISNESILREAAKLEARLDEVEAALNDLKARPGFSPSTLALIKEDWIATLNNFGRIYILAREFDRADARLGKVLQIDPTNRLAVRARGDGLLMQGRYTEAAEFFVAILKKDAGRNSIFSQFLAEVLQQNEEDQRALRLIEGAIAREKAKNLDLEFVRCRVLLNLGREEDARKSFEVANRLLAGVIDRLDFTSRRQIEGLQALVAAEYYDRTGQKAKAQRSFKEAIRHYTGYYDTEYKSMEAVWCYIAFLSRWATEKADPGRFAEAIRIGRKLLEAYPFFPPAHQVIIGPLISTGKEMEALERIEWQIEHNVAISSDVLANLILLVFAEETPIKDQSRSLLAAIKMKADARNFDRSISAATGILREYGIWGDRDGQKLSLILDPKK